MRSLLWLRLCAWLVLLPGGNGEPNRPPNQQLPLTSFSGRQQQQETVIMIGNTHTWLLRPRGRFCAPLIFLTRHSWARSQRPPGRHTPPPWRQPPPAHRHRPPAAQRPFLLQGAGQPGCGCSQPALTARPPHPQCSCASSVASSLAALAGVPAPTSPHQGVARVSMPVSRGPNVHTRA